MAGGGWESWLCGDCRLNSVVPLVLCAVRGLVIEGWTRPLLGLGYNL